MKQFISAKIVADSIDERGNRITSFILTYPRFIHSELMTHRMFSRNSASSRAIPFKKMIQMVEEDPFIPIAWQKDHKGMQGTEYFTNERISNYSEYLDGNEAVYQLEEEWLEAKNCAIEQAKNMNQLGLTKQLCNRLLEPFMWHTVLVTATEYENFFELRCPKYMTPVSRTVGYCKSWKQLVDNHSSEINLAVLDKYKNDWTFKMQHSYSEAEIHIQALAEAMWDAMNESIPKKLEAGEWHIPFGDKIGVEKLANLNPNEKDVIKVAIARCARLSYMTFDGEINYEKDIALHNQLLEDKHLSPFEHCARTMTQQEYYSFVKGGIPTGCDEYGIFNLEYYPFIHQAFSEKEVEYVNRENPNNGNRFGWCANFRGFISYRYLIENVHKM